ncbi:hypothetical protein BGZ79_003116 [Entomortierella chlamydospora]|nr:hypothetical protein BGZ79_003116 [Entomortierella chlamydospora]
MLNNYEPNDIYGCDEARFDLKIGPNNERKAGPKYGNRIIQESKIAILLCCNATGSDKRKLFVLSKHIPKGVTEETLHMQEQGRKIALIFTNLLKYIPLEQEGLSNIAVIRLPNPETFKAHPMCVGVAKAFRVLYAQQMLEAMHRSGEIPNQSVSSASRVKNRTLWSYLAPTWDNVSLPSIRYCFSRSSVMPKRNKKFLNALETESTRPINDLKTELIKKYGGKNGDPSNPRNPTVDHYFISIDAKISSSIFLSELGDMTAFIEKYFGNVKMRQESDFIDEDEIDSDDGQE